MKRLSILLWLLTMDPTKFIKPWPMSLSSASQLVAFISVDSRMTSWLYLLTKELYVPLSNPSKDVINILCLCRNFCKSISFVRREFAFLSVPRYILCFLSLSRHVNFVNKKPYQGIIEILLKSFSIESFNSYRFIRLAGVLTFNIVYCFLKSCFD